MFKILVTIARIIVGILLIISGFVKLNDPIGFSFKLEEYFNPEVFNLAFLIPYTFVIALFITIFETVLGIMILVGYKRKITLWSLLSLILFFGFLTFYSAYFNKVTDCGCFGDAIKLTPWQSFFKNVILLGFIILLFLGEKFLKPFKYASLIVISITFLCVGYTYYVYNHLPVIDFRPYRVGVNILEGMRIPKNAPKSVYEYAWRFNINGEEKIITTNGDYPSTVGTLIDVKTKETKKGYEPSIYDFIMEKDGIDYTNEIMQWDKVFVLVSREIEKANNAGMVAIQKQLAEASKKGYKVIGLSASKKSDVMKIKKQYKMDLDFYFGDLTTIKTIVRSNPAIVILHYGTISQKLHFNDAEECNFKN